MRCRTLNLIDIMSYKKNLFWGRYYYGKFEKSQLLNTVYFSYYFDSNSLIEIHNIDNPEKDFVNQFLHEYASKNHIRYFIRELNENLENLSIAFMQELGFRRYCRNYELEYHVNSAQLPNQSHSIFCRELEDNDILKLLEIDSSAQCLEYRDALIKNTKFFRERINDVFVFVDSSDLDRIQAFAFKRTLESGTAFEFIIHPRQPNLIEECLDVFAEKYIYFDKTALSFRFIINENLYSQLNPKPYTFISCSQMLIKEGSPRSRISEPKINEALDLLRNEVSGKRIA